MTSIPVTVSGRYAPAEDAVLISWDGRWIEAAVALGRSLESVSVRVAKLRREGLMP